MNLTDQDPSDQAQFPPTIAAPRARPGNATRAKAGRRRCTEESGIEGRPAEEAGKALISGQRGPFGDQLVHQPIGGVRDHIMRVIPAIAVHPRSECATVTLSH
jgi:hypothetical protein